MIKSMTAYAATESSTETHSVNIEIKGYNSRYLDIALKLPNQYAVFEDKIRHSISDSVIRGRIELKISIREIGETIEAFQLNEPLAAAYYDILLQLKNKFEINSEIGLALLSGKHGIIETADPSFDVDELWQVVSKNLDSALDRFDSMKTIEGEALARDLESRLSYIENCVGTIENKTGDLLILYQEKLKSRIEALTNGIIEIDPARITQEAAILADKSDISEEIVRANSHLQQFRHIMAENSPSGKPLNFLLQEFNREFNTMGSKTGEAEVAHIIVSVKTELEKMREQIQNVE